jgi:hypothetical protein
MILQWSHIEWALALDLGASVALCQSCDHRQGSSSEVEMIPPYHRVGLEEIKPANSLHTVSNSVSDMLTTSIPTHINHFILLNIGENSFIYLKLHLRLILLFVP